MKVTITEDAYRQALDLPLPIRKRIRDLLARLEAWPAVSGAKPLRHNLAGSYRLRTGDCRVQFRVSGQVVIVEKIGYRKDFYED